jgi:hypothetical protein
MDDDEHCVIGEGANAKGGEQGRPPKGKAKVAETRRDQRLPDDDSEGDRRRDGVVPDQGFDLRMGR